MGAAAIPVDLFNPGQVFACLGFLEAADTLLEGAEGGFDWSDAGNVKFVLSASDEENPFAKVLGFLVEANLKYWAPIGYTDAETKGKYDEEEETADEDNIGISLELSEVFPAGKGDRMALPIKLGGGNRQVVELGHWADGSNRNSFKLYAGNRSAERIARAMLQGVRKKPTKKQKASNQMGDLRTKGIAQLWEEDRTALVKAPFDLLTPMGGSFNFDPRGAWTAIDVGYSPNQHSHVIKASPVVEILAAWGLEHARPCEFDVRQVRYAVWGEALPAMLARPALCGTFTTIPSKRFRFELGLSGKNKVITFAQEEPYA